MAAQEGSPPRVWGQFRHRPLETLLSRFTPTRVGTIVRSGPRRMSSSVHPHACGDNNILTAQEAADVGSPPRVWGQYFVNIC